MIRQWIIAPVESGLPDRFEKVWQFDLANNAVTIGWGELGDISKMSHQDFWKLSRRPPEKPVWMIQQFSMPLAQLAGVAMEGIRTTLLSLAIIVIANEHGTGAERSGITAQGHTILEKHCARCHSISAKGESPLPKAPPLRDIYLRYPLQQLSEGLAEGMGSRHRQMPQIQFSSDEVAAILDYLGAITKVAPAERTVIEPGEPQTVPP
jgi:mono/diheme cytochrome c family protein